MTFLYFFDLFGVFAFAISGALLGIKKDMDVYGQFVLAFVVAVGGGTTRDMILGNTPVFLLTDQNYLFVTIAAVLMMFVFSGRVEKHYKYLLVMDAIGLGVFTVIGSTKALEAGLDWYAVILCAVITSTGGGMIRDILAGEIPFVLRKEVYASASMLGAVIFLGLNAVNLNSSLSAFITASAVTGVRLITYKGRYNLPKGVKR